MTKKTLLLIGIIITTLYSCRKQYTCECSSTVVYKTNFGFNTRTFAGDKKPFSEKLSKKQAKSACDHMGVSIETNFKNLDSNNGEYPLEPGESITTSCTIVF